MRLKNKFSYFQIIALSMLLVGFLSCGDNGPVNHSTIAGTWRCEETTSFGNRSYLIDIDRKVSDTTQYVISNFYNIGDVEYIVAKLKSGKLTISQQPSANITVSSFSGTVIDLTQINLSYVVRDGSNDYSVSAVYTRK